MASQSAQECWCHVDPDVFVLVARHVEDGKANVFVVEKDALGNHPAGVLQATAGGAAWEAAGAQRPASRSPPTTSRVT